MMAQLSNQETVPCVHVRFLESCLLLTDWCGDRLSDVLSEAVAIIRECVKARPGSALFAVELGYRLALQGNSEARLWIDHALALEKNYARAWSTLGHLLVESDDCFHAEEYYALARRLNHRFHCPRYGAAMLSVARGEHESALREFESLLIDFPGNHAALVGVAICETLMGNPAKAEDCVLSVLAQDSMHRAALFASLGLAIARGDGGKVRERIETLTRIDGKSTELEWYTHLADRLRARGPMAITMENPPPTIGIGPFRDLVSDFRNAKTHSAPGGRCWGAEE